MNALDTNIVVRGRMPDTVVSIHTSHNEFPLCCPFRLQSLL